MAFVLNAHITFAASRGREQLVLKTPSRVAINSGWQLLTDTCEIEIARNVQDFDSQSVNDVFRAGDPVTVSLGYNNNLLPEFEGFITRVSADTPIKIYCQDYMWKLKQLPAHISLADTTLKALLQRLILDYPIRALEVGIGPVRYSNATVSQVLEDLKRKYKLYSYIQNGALISGQIYQDNTDPPKVFHLERNVAANNLKYRNADDFKLLVRAVSTLKNGNRISVETGESGGETRQLAYYNLTSKEDLMAMAQADYDRIKVDGYTGELEAFGAPQISHGDKAKLVSDIYPERSGVYYVDQVFTEFGSANRFRRKIKLGGKVNG